MLRKVEERKLITCVKISRGSPSIFYILFADDTFVFCKASVREGSYIMKILDNYELASGKKVNMGKCSVSFEKRTREGNRREVTTVLGMKEVQDQVKYLGLPSHIGRTNKEVFSFVRTRVEE
ncbi:hypothetical protein LIER_13204 [Lithospermum erythrorhizon]|uniref:Reverse transcriptase n=1 Tax=Lithospermum erythrorhizon TaxID=34254 RepID=A0AAV3PWT8_LITER